MRLALMKAKEVHKYEGPLEVNKPPLYEQNVVAVVTMQQSFLPPADIKSMFEMSILPPFEQQLLD